ncbi:MAG: glycoside hydrolase family 3 C-terminal domain-containing protein [Clostridia bacterium]|nr:glycoside hydrolase family 3 C-terminal domain-containing protein [Clostridia bacterium]
MLKNKELIDKLTVDQKLSILTDGKFLASAHAQGAGLPLLRIEKFSAVNDDAEAGEVYPSFAALANSWNPSAITEISKNIGLKAKTAGVNALFLPRLTPRGNAFDDGISEDPYLVGRLGGACGAALTSVGVTPVLGTCGLKKSDASYSDLKPDPKAVAEYYLESLRVASKECPHGAVASSYKHLKGEYREVNIDLVNRLMRKHIAKNKFTIAESTDMDLAVESVAAGNALCLEGHLHSLKDAVERYLEIQKLVEEGEATAEELDEAVRDGNALSISALDEAVDSVLEFAAECQHRAETTAGAASTFAKERLQLELAEQSVVLLKNKNGLLPLSGGKKVAVIGAAGKDYDGRSLAELLNVSKSVGVELVGYETGYDYERPRSDDLVEQAVALAKKSEVVLLFLGGEDRERKISATKCTKLPANQTVLLEKLSETGKKIVVLLTGSGRTQLSFDKYCDGLLFTPYAGKNWSQAIANILTGKSNPSGKLPFTLYEDADERFETLKRYKNEKRNKIGSFIGYRRYDSDGETLKYPFGFGLSYTKFAYSSIKLDSGGVEFTVKNIGNRKGTEIAQIYIGKSESAMIRPKKQLKGFARITLKPGESKTVRHTIKSSDLSVYDATTGDWIVENGRYEVYVASSVQDIRLEGRLFVGSGRTVAKTQERESDYLQGKSNVISGGYVMETSVDMRAYRKQAKWFGFISIVLAVLCDLVYLIWELLSGDDIQSPFDDGGMVALHIAIIAIFNLLMVFGIAAICVCHSKKKAYEKDPPIEIKSRENEETAKIERAYEELFLSEFTEEEEEDDSDEEVSFVVEEERDEYFRHGLTLRDLVKDFVPFAAERGITLDQATARTVFTALSVSRLMIVRSENTASLPKFYEVLSEYLGCSAFADDAGNYQTSDDLLFKIGSKGNYVKTNLLRAATVSEAEGQTVRTAYLGGVKLEAAGNWFTQMIRYVTSPERPFALTAKNKSITDKSYPVSPNLWLILALAEGERTEEIPAYIAEAATVVDLKFAQTEEAFEQTESSPLSFHQFVMMGDDAREGHELDEEKWKKIDKLESYVNARAKYGIGNRLWQKMERYISVYLACDGDKEDALDEMVAVKLLPTVLPLISKNRKENDELFAHVLENVFGEDHLERCRKAVEASGVDLMA